MAHRIIIINRAIAPFSTTEHTHEPVLEYEVTYTPPHDVPLHEQNQRTAKIRRLLARIEATASGEPDPGDE